jgi:hypothetical protein
MAEALAEFTRKSGAERTTWCDEDIYDRIKIIENRFPGTNLSFGASTISIYRHSSEILHGTYFGVRYFWTDSAGRRVSSRQEAEHLFLANHFVAVFSAAFFALQGLIDIISREYALLELKAHNSTLLQDASALIESDLVHLPAPMRS